MFGPLTFEEHTAAEDTTETLCFLCDQSFKLKTESSLFFKHIFEAHSVVIDEPTKLQPFLSEYINYWKEKFKVKPMESTIPSIAMQVGQYYLMSSLLEEDKKLRHKLKLSQVVEQQEFERNDKSFKKNCLFCRLEFKGTRQDFVVHLEQEHNLQLGNPQNLVFIEELIGNIESKLTDLRCLYCDKIFPDRSTLKEHMRKKLHKRINSANKDFDQFYMVNYLEVGKNWTALQKENDLAPTSLAPEENKDEEYGDWNEHEQLITCLFCQHKEEDINLLCLHMESSHKFNFVDLTSSLDFYQKVKLVNFIRKQIYSKKCPFCEETCDGNLTEHLTEEQHCKIPERKMFDQPEYYFPTYEDDAFLYFIEDVEVNNEPSTSQDN